MNDDTLTHPCQWDQTNPGSSAGLRHSSVTVAYFVSGNGHCARSFGASICSKVGWPDECLNRSLLRSPLSQNCLASSQKSLLPALHISLGGLTREGQTSIRAASHLCSAHWRQGLYTPPCMKDPAAAHHFPSLTENLRALSIPHRGPRHWLLKPCLCRSTAR